MKKVKRILFLSLVVISLYPFLVTCHRSNDYKNVRDVDLEQIKKRGRLIAVTDCNSMNYFIYKGQPLGYQYELLQEFSNFLGIRIQVLIAKDPEQAFKMLYTGETDIVAMNLTVTNERKKQVSFTVPNSQSRQVLVQRAPGVAGISGIVLPTPGLIRDHMDLANKGVMVYVQKKSSFSQRLKHLSDEMGDSINIREVNEEAEELLEEVATGEIDYAVCDENIARVASTYFPNLDFATPISFTQKLAWAVRKDSPSLLNVLNSWLEEFKRTSQFAAIYNKYFENSRTSEIFNNNYFVTRTGRFSQFDDLIRKYSNKINWDWTLLASLIYQESHFDPNARSWNGAFGLMQLMPSVLSQYGVDSLSTPERNIEAGVKLIAWIDMQLSTTIDPEDRVKFILAAYNIGLGHVWDAQRLAEKYGRNPNHWLDVEYFLTRKNLPQYYQDPIVKNGYCKGQLAVNYVSDVLDLYEQYKNVISERKKE